MTPIALRLHRFGSFAGTHELRFPTAPGLYFMGGRNDAEPRLGGNGAGKSTVWRALTWALFGKDPRSLKASDVANWGAPKGAWVEFDFEHHGWLHTVRRTHAPNSWTISAGDSGGWVDLTKGVANPLEAILRLEFVPFLNTVLIAQGEPMFLDLKAEPKAALFAEVMGLDVWVRASARAAELAADRERERATLGVQVAELRGRLQSMPSAAHQTAADEWRAGQTRAATLLRDKYDVALESADRIRAELERVEIEYEVSTNELRWADETKAAETAAEIKAGRARNNALVSLKTAAAEHGRWLTALGDINLDQCPTCGAPHPGSGPMAAKIEQSVKNAASTVDAAHDAADAAGVRHERAEDAVTAAKQKAEAARDAVRKADVAIRLVRARLGAQEAALDAMEDDAERMRDARNPYGDALRDSKEEERRIRAELDEALRRHDAAAERNEMLGFWVRGFKDVRLREIGTALAELDAEANNGVAALGLAGWQLEFEVDRETASGSVSRGFDVYVKSPRNDQRVPFAAWSGGEAQRLRVAAQMGLADHVRSRTGATLSLEVWDEPTRGMNAGGIADMLRALRERAHAESRQVWLVDHHVLGYAGFDGTVTVVRDAEGSRFEYDEI